MEIRVSKNAGNIYLVKLSGHMDTSSSNQLKDLVMAIIRTSVESFVINLDKVASISSAGMGALVSVFSTLTKLDCPLVIVAKEGTVLQTLEAARIKSYFTIAHSLKEALAFIDGGENQTCPERKVASESVNGLP